MLPHLLLMGAVAFVYLATLCPGAFWLDSSEFVAGAYTLGVVHPPGHPLYIMFGKAASLLIPFGDIGFRVNVLSAVMGAVCALFVARIVALIYTLLDRAVPEAHWCGVAAAGLFAVTPACWMQSIRAEVYTLNAAIILALVELALRWWQRPRVTYAYIFCALAGLGLANHHYLVFFFIPAALVLVLFRREGRELIASRRLFVALAFVLAGLMTYAYIPVRASTSPEINWGHATTVERFVDVVTAQTFQGSVTEEARSESIAQNLGTATSMFAEQLGPMGLLVGAFGLVMLGIRRRGPGLFLISVALLNTMTKAVMLIDPDNPDDYGYFMLGVGLLSVGVGLVPAYWKQRALGPLWAALIAAGACGMAWDRSDELSLATERSAEVVTDTMLNSVAPSSVILVNYYALYFNHWYAQLVDQKRPDVVLVQATFDSKRDDGRPYIAALRNKHPDLNAVLDEYLEQLQFPLKSLTQLAKHRPVYLEPFPEKVFSPEVIDSVGLLRRMNVQERTDAAAKVADKQYWDSALAALGLGSVDTEATKLLQFTHFIHASMAIRQGLPQTARQIIARAKGLGATSRHFETLISMATALEKAKDPTIYRDWDPSSLLISQ